MDKRILFDTARGISILRRLTSSNFWLKCLMLCEDKKEYYDASLIIEICLCTTCSNTTLE